MSRPRTPLDPVSAPPEEGSLPLTKRVSVSGGPTDIDLGDLVYHRPRGRAPVTTQSSDPPPLATGRAGSSSVGPAGKKSNEGGRIAVSTPVLTND